MRSNLTKKGFTLLEILIAMIFLAVIAIFIATSIHYTYKDRDQLLVQGDFYNSIRLTLQVLDKDLSLFFSPQIMMPDSQGASDRLTPEDAMNLQNTLRMDIERPSEYYSGIISKSGIRPVRFVGTKEKISFVAISHRRIYKESPESIFSKIAFELDNDTAEKAVGKILVKVENSNAFDIDDDDRDPHIKRYKMLHGITNLEFKFYWKEKEQWLTNWDSDKPDFKNIYPDIVRVQFDVQGPIEKLKFTGVYDVKPELPIYGFSPSL